MRRVFGLFEAVFDISYLTTASALGVILLLGGADNSTRTLAGGMALVLVLGDSFHLAPRIAVIISRDEKKHRASLGRGKQIASITMSCFYLILWQIGVIVFSPDNGQISICGGLLSGVWGGIVFSPDKVRLWSYLIYFLTALRILLCLLPQNKWTERYPPVAWGIARNIPFFMAGIIVAGLFFVGRGALPGLGLMWLAVLLSFAFYLPVVLWSNKNPKLGMLMLPKTAAYVWMLVMSLSL